MSVTSGTAPTVSTIYNVAQSAGAAHTQFSLALNTGNFTKTGATLSYTQNADTAKRITDASGNAIGSFTGVAIVESFLGVNEISGGFISASEDDAALTISGTSNGLTTGTTVTVGLDGSGDGCLGADGHDGGGRDLER